MMDTVCLLNVLTGDPFYVDYYKDEYDRFEPQLTPATRSALANLKRKIKDEKKGIISAFLALYFSATDDRTLDDMLVTLQHSESMRTRLKQTTYYSESGWRLYESVRENLRTVFLFLKGINFEGYWRQNILPKIKSKIAEIEKDLPKYNVVNEVERLLGSRLPSNALTIYILNYSQPHGIRITGLRFLTNAAYPFRIVLRNAVHEPMHPLYNLARDAKLKETLDTLRADTFLMDKVNNHNPAFGYNSFAGFIEEDCIQAIEQIINEKFGVEVEARKRWKENDEGIHVFAVALYSVMKDENFVSGREPFRDFLIRMISSGKLAAGRIEPINDVFYSGAEKTAPLVIGDTFTIDSKTLNETRRINVYLPPDYADSSRTRFPALYMPDGGLAEDFLHVAGLVQISVSNGTMRPFLLVGIENTERRRDLTGPTENDKKIAPRSVSLCVQ